MHYPTDPNQTFAGTLGATDTSSNLVAPASGTTYFVASSGNDSNSGTIDHPFKTLQAAINQVHPDAKGTTINLRGGTYDQKGWDWISSDHAGTATGHLVIRPYQNEHVTLDGASIGIAGDYVDIEKLEVKNTADMGIAAWGANHVRILDNVVHDSQSMGISMQNSDTQTGGNNVISGNTVYHTVLSNRPRSIGINAGGWGQALSSFCPNDTIENNTVYENYGEGIVAGNHQTVRHNVVHDNYNVEMYIGDASNTTLEQNLIYNTGNTDYYAKHDGVTPTAASGIQLGIEGAWWIKGQGNDKLDHLKIINNIVIGGIQGFYYGNYGVGGGMKNSVIANNTFYGNDTTTDALMRIDGSAGHTNNRVANNVFVEGSGHALTGLPDNLNGAVSFDHNLWSGGTPDHPAKSSSDVMADPKLVNPGGLSAADYKERTGSPVYNAGVALAEVNNDFFNRARPQHGGYDVGAYQL